MSPSSKTSRIALWLSLALLLLALPIALMAGLLIPNEYAAQGIKGAADCDGPLGVMIFAIPGYVIYGAGAIVFGILFIRKKRWGYAMIASLCLLVVILISPNVGEAFREHTSDLHRRACGNEW